MMMFARLKSLVNRWPTWWTMFFIFTSQLTLNWQALKGNNCSDVNRINVDGGKIQKSANKWLCRLSIAELCKNSYFVEILSCQSWRVVARLCYLHHPPSLHTVMVAEKQDLSEFEHRKIRFSLFIYSDGNCILYSPLSNLHLRPSELALVKIVNINMDKTKISGFITEQRMARHWQGHRRQSAQ